jgi:hypothetical protein
MITEGISWGWWARINRRMLLSLSMPRCIAPFFKKSQMTTFLIKKIDNNTSRKCFVDYPFQSSTIFPFLLFNFLSYSFPLLLISIIFFIFLRFFHFKYIHTLLLDIKNNLRFIYNQSQTKIIINAIELDEIICHPSIQVSHLWSPSLFFIQKKLIAPNIKQSYRIFRTFQSKTFQNRNKGIRKKTQEKKLKLGQRWRVR